MQIRFSGKTGITISWFKFLFTQTVQESEYHLTRLLWEQIQQRIIIITVRRAESS